MEKMRVVAPDRVREKIDLLMQQVTPIETALSEMGIESKELLDSCKEYHSFICEMLEDMYSYPLEYGFVPGKLEAFLDGKEINSFKLTQPTKIKALLTEADDGPYSYYRFLYEVAIRAEQRKMNLFISQKKYEEIRIQFDNYMKPQKKNKNFLVDYDIRLAAFTRNGLIVKEADNGVEISNNKYPQMFGALLALAESVASVKTFGMQGFYHCEFRMITSRHKPDFNDILQPLSVNNKEMMIKLNEIALQGKMSPSYNTFWKVNYKWKNRQVMQFSITGKELTVTVTGAVDEEQRKLLTEYVKDEEPAFVTFIQDNLKACTGCAYDHIGVIVDVFGTPRRVCSNAISVRVRNPEEKDVEFLIKFIEYRKKLIIWELE